jgi:hypothetical protein
VEPKRKNSFSGEIEKAEKNLSGKKSKRKRLGQHQQIKVGCIWISFFRHEPKEESLEYAPANVRKGRKEIEEN